MSAELRSRWWPHYCVWFRMGRTLGINSASFWPRCGRAINPGARPPGQLAANSSADYTARPRARSHPCQPAGGSAHTEGRAASFVRPTFEGQGRHYCCGFVIMPAASQAGFRAPKIPAQFRPIMVCLDNVRRLPFRLDISMPKSDKRVAPRSATTTVWQPRPSGRLGVTATDPV